MYVIERLITLTLTQKIKELADSKNTNFAEIERKIGLSNGQIRRWDTSSPKAENLEKVADYFGVSVDYLLGREEEKLSSKDLDDLLDNAMSFDGKPMTEHDREVIRAYLQGKFGE